MEQAAREGDCADEGDVQLGSSVSGRREHEADRDGGAAGCDDCVESGWVAGGRGAVERQGIGNREQGTGALGCGFSFALATYRLESSRARLWLVSGCADEVGNSCHPEGERAYSNNFPPGLLQLA